MTELCGQCGISRKTGYKWLARHAEGGMKALEDRSRAPKSVPGLMELRVSGQSFVFHLLRSQIIDIDSQ